MVERHSQHREEDRANKGLKKQKTFTLFVFCEKLKSAVSFFKLSLLSQHTYVS